MVEASWKNQITVGAFSLPVKVVCQSGHAQTIRKQVFCKISAISSKFELVMPPAVFTQVTISETMSDGHCTRQTKFAPVPSGSFQTPPAPMPKASQNPSAVRKRWTNSTKKCGQARKYLQSLCQCEIY